MIVFISGPMTGLPNYNREAFFEAERKLKAQGHIVWNPAYHPDGLTHEQYMTVCRAEIDVSDEIYMLRGWEKSQGANEEWNRAINKRKTIRYEIELCPFCGGEAKTYDESAEDDDFNEIHSWSVQCQRCGADVLSASDTEADAIEAWNRRHHD